MKFLYLMWRNLMRKKVRTFLTVASIFIAFVLYGVLLAVKTGLSSGVDLQGLDRLITIHKVSLIQPLPQSYLHKIRTVEGVEDIAHAVWFQGVYQDPKNFFGRIAVSENYLDIYPEIVLDEEQRRAWQANLSGAIVGRATADRFGFEVGDRIPIQGDIWRRADGSAWEFTIEGIYEAGEKGFETTNLFFHHKYLTEGTGIEGVVGWYILSVEDPDRSAELVATVDQLFANSPAETKTSTEKAFAQGFANQVGDIGKIVMSVLAVVFFTLLLVAGNTVAQSVRERTNELGVLKTLGFTDTQVMGMVLGESYLLTLFGGGTGLALVVWATNTFDLGGTMLPTIYMPTYGIWIGIGLLLFMGLAAGFIPAYQALRLTIVDALKGT